MTKSHKARLDLRKAARGKPCMVRLPGCDGGGETTVLAHYRMIDAAGMGGSGIGQKPPDIIGAWACRNCHDLADRRTGTNEYEYDFIRLAHAEGCLRSIARLVKDEVL